MTISRILMLGALLLGATWAHAERVTLGKLGQSLKKTNIYSKTSTKSRVYYKLKPYEYLVVQRTNQSGWFKVLLKNGYYGYVSSEKVAQLPYDVTAEAPSKDLSTVSSRAAAVANYALNFRGTPYKWGGNDLQSGIDCSGFVKQLFGKIDVSLPRTAAEQVNVGTPITRLEDLQAGDRLYFWDKKRGKVGHTGIYLGGGYFVHSSSGRHGVATDSLGLQRWRRILVAARRS